VAEVNLLADILGLGNQLRGNLKRTLRDPVGHANAQIGAYDDGVRQAAATGDSNRLIEALGIGPGALFGTTKAVVKGLRAGTPLTRADMKALEVQGEEDITRSLKGDKRLDDGGTIPARELKTAHKNRERYRAEPRTLPKPLAEMTDEDFIAFGKRHGVDMSQTPMRSLGISDIKSRREVMLPGGYEGKFTIPDTFAIKANNFDPAVLGQENHNKLMQKFIRTYERPGGSDAVDTFNDLNFSLLSPNAPLTQNEFLAQRFRLRTPQELKALAKRADEPNLAQALDVESGVGAGARGGLGVKGTANLENQAELARLLQQKPEMFRPGEGETLRDVGFRVMNQVPGLSVKTASLGVPWTDLNKANTSAVDLWMIRNGYKQLLQDNPRFAQRMADLRATNPKLPEEKAAINIISDHPEAVYRTADGNLHPNLPDYLQPNKLAYEPGKFTRPSEYYTDIMRQVDESRGANPAIELFPEQWRKWDVYRGRVEPHEMAHPDYRKLPKQSWSELQEAYREHQRMGYTNAATGNPTQAQSDWKKLYYGKVDPRLLIGGGAASAGAVAANSAFDDGLVGLLMGNNEQPATR
jgi:hypothetical protein